MERAEFQYSVARAGESAQLTNLPKFKNFWDSYRRGLRHYYYGKEYQNVKEPEIEEIDYEILGYELGYSGMPFSEAYRELTCLEVYRNVLVKYIKS